MILAIRTDNPVAELYLCQDDKLIDSYQWEAHRQLADTIHLKINNLLLANNLNWSDINGLVVYSGPGSFTGLRIGVTVANTISYSNNTPIVGATGENWLQEGLSLVASGDNYRVITPAYGGQAHITKPKK